MRKVKKQKRVVLFNFKVNLALITLVSLASLFVVFSLSMLSKTNVEVERQKKLIQTQEKKNESLKMKINELASLDKIQEIAKEQGLSYNNDNIKSIIE